MNDRVTLFVDASYCATTKAAGYGVWMISDALGGARTAGGPITTECANSSEAELCGAANALSILSELIDPKTTVVTLQMDNTRALGAVLGHVKKARRSKVAAGSPAIYPTKRPSNLERKCVGFIASLGFTIFVKHVTAHVQDGDGRHGINSKCDEIAKLHMQKQRGLLAAQS